MEGSFGSSIEVWESNGILENELIAARQIQLTQNRRRSNTHLKKTPNAQLFF